MERRVFEIGRGIIEIGRGGYKFDRKTLNAFIEESNNRAPARDQGAGLSASGDRANAQNDKEFQQVFGEFMVLYHDYMRCESVDLLVRLKRSLEEISIRYQSHVLAAEVLNINCCLPYECRVLCGRQQSR